MRSRGSSSSPTDSSWQRADLEHRPAGRDHFDRHTPFDRQGAVDRPGLRRLVAYLIDAGAVGLAMTGSASESAWLDGAERRQLAEWTADAVDGRVPLIAGANAPDTAEPIGFARHSIASGAETVFCGPPLMDREAARISSGISAALPTRSAFP